jgi:hypothetical protein
MWDFFVRFLGSSNVKSPCKLPKSYFSSSQGPTNHNPEQEERRINGNANTCWSFEATAITFIAQEEAKHDQGHCVTGFGGLAGCDVIMRKDVNRGRNSTNSSIYSPPVLVA